MEGGEIWADGRIAAGRAMGAGGPLALAFSCSPRGGRGATELVLASFLRGFVEGGGRVELLNPYRMSIAPCRGCFTCWIRTPGRCAISDDMGGVLERLQAADAVVFATPVYHFSFSEGMKRVLERTMPLLDPLVRTGPDGMARHVRVGRRGQWAVLIATCGFPEVSVFDPLREAFRRICDMMEWGLRGEILRTMAGLLLSKDERCRQSSTGYLQLVRGAGRKLAGGDVLDAAYRSYLEAELVPRELYFELVNSWFGKRGQG
ncbi:MAG: flavodoxin family protein [Thermoplasmatota archaeon]